MSRWREGLREIGEMLGGVLRVGLAYFGLAAACAFGFVGILWLVNLLR